MSGFKTPLWRTLSVAAVLLSAKIASADVVAADILFAVSGANDVNKLSLNDSVNLYSGANQGWWSPTWDNTTAPANYLVGTLDDSMPGEPVATHYFNNFFVFNLEGVSGPVSSASLFLQFYIASSSRSHAPSLSYQLFDVSTDIDDLFKKGTSASIFADLGAGTAYGMSTFSVGLDWFDVVEVELNGAALADLNAAIDRGAKNFAIGGTLVVPQPDGRSVPDSASTFALFGATAAGIWALRNRKKAA